MCWEDGWGEESWNVPHSPHSLAVMALHQSCQRACNHYQKNRDVLLTNSGTNMSKGLIEPYYHCHHLCSSLSITPGVSELQPISHHNRQHFQHLTASIDVSRRHRRPTIIYLISFKLYIDFQSQHHLRNTKPTSFEEYKVNIILMSTDVACIQPIIIILLLLECKPCLYFDVSVFFYYSLYFFQFFFVWNI